MFHLHIVKTLSHYLLHVVLLRRDALVVRHAGARRALLSMLLVSLRPRLIRRLLDSSNTASLSRTRQALLLLLGLCILPKLLLVLV